MKRPDDGGVNGPVAGSARRPGDPGMSRPDAARSGAARPFPWGWCLLVLLVASLRGHSAYARWFRQWDGRSKEAPEPKPAPPQAPIDPASRKGPWG